MDGLGFEARRLGHSFRGAAGRSAQQKVGVKARGHRDVVTVVGHAATIAPGEWITASGEWVNYWTHGQQFKARFLRTSPPTSADGIASAGVSTGNFNTNGFLVGGTLGANYQTGLYLVGFEGDIDWSSVQGSSSAAACVALGAAAGTTCQTKSPWLGTARARVGYAFDRLLVFGTGGAAFSGLQAFLNRGGSISPGPSQLGWTAGAGVEYAFT